MIPNAENAGRECVYGALGVIFLIAVAVGIGYGAYELLGALWGFVCS